jgi:transcriptional regulator with XRE-family HTH domain
MQEKLSNMINNISTGTRLTDFIKALGQSKGGFAEILGIPSSQLSRYLGDSAQMPQKEILTKLFNLGCNLNWLLTGEGERYAENEAGRALQKKANAYNAERDDNVGQVLDGFDLLESRVYTDVITEEEVNVLESLTKKLRKLV